MFSERIHVCACEQCLCLASMIRDQIDARCISQPRTLNSGPILGIEIC